MAESLNFQKTIRPADRILTARVKPRHLELALGLLYQLEILTVTHKRSRSFFQLEAQLPPNASPGFILKRVLGFVSLPKKEKIFFDTRLKTLKNQDWATSHLRYLKPLIFHAPEAHPDFPPLLRVDPRGDKTRDLRPDTLYVNSSLAFGTGSHPSTQMAAELLWEALVRVKKKTGRAGSVLDVGCGTGILALIAKRLSGAKVVAVDNDPIAVAVARENFARNRLKSALFDDLKKVKGRYPVVVANILLSTLTEIKSDLVRKLDSQGFLILSGLLYRDVTPLKKAYSEFQVVRRISQKGWTALALEKKRPKKANASFTRSE